MYTIHGKSLVYNTFQYVPTNAAPEPGGKEIDEIELGHLDGHKGSRPVRIGNGAADHIQLVGHSLLVGDAGTF